MHLFTRLKIGTEQFPALTGIRAVAAIMVFFHHLQFWFGPGIIIGLQLSFHYGVCLFFVLSGFLITYKYSDNVEFNGAWLRQYFVRRFARIYPVYFLILTVVILFYKIADPIFLLQNYTLLHSLPPLIPSHGMAIAPSWSLTVEECFYLVAPFIFLLTRKYSLGLPFLLFILLSAAVVMFNGDGISIYSQFVFLTSTIFGRFPEFFAGILLALIVRRKQKNNVTTIPGIKYTVLGMSIIVLLTLPLIYITNKPDLLAQPVRLAVCNLLLPVAISIFYYGLIFENSLIRKLLALPISGLLGRSSYAFYLLHLPVIFFLSGRFHEHHNLYVVCAFLFSVLLSILIYIFYEEPARRFITKWSTSSKNAV